jgi:hypothetical protein
MRYGWKRAHASEGGAPIKLKYVSKKRIDQYLSGQMILYHRSRHDCVARIGYGITSVGGTRRVAHRVSYELAKGPIPEGKVLRHSCDTPRCVNPEHLTPGTQADNMADRATRGRNPRGMTHGRRRKLTEEHVGAIRSLFAIGSLTVGQLAARYGVSETHVNNIVHHRVWRLAS